MRLHESLKSLGGGGGGRSAARDAIMARYSHILPGLARLGLTSRPLLRGPAGPYTRYRYTEKNIKLMLQLHNVMNSAAHHP